MLVTTSWGLCSLCLGWGFHHVGTCYTPVGQTLPTTLGSESLCCPPFTARHKQCTSCLCRCNDKAAALVLVVLWCWKGGDDELQMWEMVKVKENSQSASRRGRKGGAGGLYDVWVHLKSKLCVWKTLCDSCGGERGEKWSSGVIVMVMYWPFRA